MNTELSPDSLGNHIGRLQRAARGMTNSREDAEDLVQETLTRVLAKRRVIVSGPVEPYLLQALRNTYVSSLRARDRRPQTAPLEETHASVPEPAELVAAREVYGVIAALPTDQRKVVTAVDVAGLAYGEAADVLGIPLGTVMSRLHRARARVAFAMRQSAAVPAAA